MEVKAKAKNIRVSPKKARLVVDLIRGMKAGEALDQLNFINKKAVLPLSKLINSGIANALNNYDLSRDNLYIKEIKVDEGRTLHRYRPRAYGRATPIRKRFSHINLVLGEIKDSGVVEPKKQEVEAPLNLSEMAQKQEQEQKSEDKKKAESKKKKEENKQESASEKKEKEKDKKEEISASQATSKTKKKEKNK